MQSADPCVECGGNALKLIDGYYYCVECNTQNTNVRETVVEQKALGDGTFAIGTRRKIVKIHDNTIQMSGEWYKWHAYNFIILGLADELVTAGAKPSFKLKLLWIWTRYIKKYQNKDALGFAKTTEEGNNDNITLPSFMVEDNSSSNPVPDEEENELANEETTKKIKNKNVIMDGSRRDIKFLSKGVILAMLYLALNLDESDIQLYHMYRFIKEKRLNFSNIQRFLPGDINVKSIQDEWLKFIHSKVCNMHRARALAMSLLRKLDLGTPKVPNMRKIVDDFLLELCLPNDIKPMIYSLMFFHRCDFLDMSSKSKEHLIQTPDYEGVAMSYVLLALKMCFGLDGDYEEKISDAVEKINDERNLSKSHRMGKYSEPSTRLFSFRDWCSYIQFRKIMLCKSSLYMAELHCLDIDDYVYLEHMGDRPQNNRDLQDETAINLIHKIPEEEEARVIPKHLFFPTLTPMHDYTDIIIEHNQDKEIRELLNEDFTQYSLNYACEYFELAGINTDNIIKGVSEDRKTVCKAILGTIVTKKSKSEMIYVKNCENRNWMITNPPRKEHVTCEDIQNSSNDKESDHGYDSEHPLSEKEISDGTGNMDNTDKSLKEVNTTVSENTVNEKEVCKETEIIDDINQNMTEDITVVNDSTNPMNIFFSEVPENVDNTDESMKEYDTLFDRSQNILNENEVSKVTEIMNDTDQSITEESGRAYDSESPAKKKEYSKVTERIDDTTHSMKEDNTVVNDAANEKELSNKTEDVDGADQSMTEDGGKGGNESENPENEKEVQKETENIVEITDQALEENKRGFIITEEDNDKNIFDDAFEELDLKDEMEQNNEEDLYANNAEHPVQYNNSIYDDRASISDVTDDDSVFATFNLDTFDREQTIKELILGACKKYKCPVPPEYKPPKESKPRKRKAATFGNEDTPREPVKRAKVNRIEAKKKVDELLSGYYSLKESDFINQMQEAVSLAIRNNQFDSVLNVSNITQNENLGNVEQASDALTRDSSISTGNVENQSNVNIQNLSTAIPQTSLLEQNPDETDDIEEIDEHWESKVFEGEEEMKLDDLVPKGDPKFDEDKYDINQLYMKIKVEEEASSLYGLQDNPKLKAIILQKIEQCKNSTEFDRLKAEPAKPLVKTKYESDSEDEIPLNVLQEERRTIEEKISWEDNFEPLINKEYISEFKYWCRHYDEDFMTRSKDWHKKFDEELKENTPSSFYFVIRECAAILNCSTFSLYKRMQNLEKFICAMAKYPDE